MTRLITISFFLLFFQTILLSQNCGPGSDNYFSACNICGNGYFGNTAGFTADNVSYSFPCGTIENSQWSSFIASSPNVNAQVTIFNCSNAQGVEFAIYDQSLNLVSTCYSPSIPTMNGGVTATGLTVGQKYLVMIDGVNGDICDFSLSIVGNATSLPPLPPGAITNDAAPGREVCVGQQVCYSIDPVANATAYEWAVPANGRILFGQGTTSICAEFDSAGGGVVRCTPSNVCYSGLPAVTVSLVLPVVPTILDPIFLCENNLPYIKNGIEYDNFGTQIETNQNAVGCDSLVHFSLIPIVTIPNQIDVNLCIGDCYMIGDSCYSDSTRIVLENGSKNGCDSLILFNPTYNLDSVTINSYRDSIYCIDSCTQFMVDATLLGQNIISNWSTSNGSVSSTNGLFAEGCGAGDYVLAFMDTLTQNSCSVSINLSENDKPIGNLDNIDLVSGVNCIDTEFHFKTTHLPNALIYNWAFPDGSTQATSSNEIRVTKAISGDLCVSAENDCGTTNTVCLSVDVAPNLSAEFAIDSRICMNQTATITYLGNAPSTAGFNFYISRGNIVSGSGTGPYAVQFNNDGNLYVGLEVEADGCESPIFNQRILVDTVIPPPNIACNANANYIEFTWNDIGIVDIFDGEVMSGQVGNQLNRLNYIVTDLAPNEAVTLEVTAFDNDNVCGTTAVSTITCFSEILIVDPPNSKKSNPTQNTLITEVELFPNPVNDILALKSLETIEKVEVYNLSGKLIRSIQYSNSIDFSNIESGIYLLKVTTEKGQTIEKIQKI